MIYRTIHTSAPETHMRAVRWKGFRSRILGDAQTTQLDVRHRTQEGLWSWVLPCNLAFLSLNWGGIYVT